MPSWTSSSFQAPHLSPHANVQTNQSRTEKTFVSDTPSATCLVTRSQTAATSLPLYNSQYSSSCRNHQQDPPLSFASRSAFIRSRGAPRPFQTRPREPICNPELPTPCMTLTVKTFGSAIALHGQLLLPQRCSPTDHQWQS